MHMQRAPVAAVIETLYPPTAMLLLSLWLLSLCCTIFLRVNIQSAAVLSRDSRFIITTILTVIVWSDYYCSCCCSRFQFFGGRGPAQSCKPHRSLHDASQQYRQRDRPHATGDGGEQ